MPAEELFTHLLQNNQLITYACAYEQLFGILPNPWRQTHAQEVIFLAMQTESRTFHRLSIQLDALVVTAAHHIPGGGYFDAHPAITLQMWNNVFGNWELF